VLCRHQVNFWRDTDTLLSHAAVAVNGSAVAEVQFGVLAAKHGDRAAAEQHYRAALVDDPNNYAAEFNFGNLLLSTDPAAAIQHYQSAALNDPAQAEDQINWGVALLKLNDPANAFIHFKQAESLDPDSYDAHYDLARLYLVAQKLPEARAQFSLALRARPGDAAATKALQATQSLP
jgi:tetratricopeptide (TPR) repeat protein